MSNLQRYEKDGLEFFIDQSTGEINPSISGYARMVGMSKGTISERLASSEKVGNLGVKTAEIDTGYGFKVVRLIPENLMKEWIKKDKPELFDRLVDCGLRVYLYGLVGYHVSATPPNSPTLQDIQKTMNLMLKQMESLTSEVTEFRAYKVSTEANYPGIVEFNSQLANMKQLPTHDLITVKQWLKTAKDIELSKGGLISFAKRVSSMYQSATHKKPQQVYTDNGTDLGFGYPIEAYPILEQAFKAFF